MKRKGRGSRSVVAVGVSLALIGGVVCVVSWPSPNQPAATDLKRFHPPGEPGQPHREMTSDHQPGRIMHKDASGLSPLEMVSTPEGMVTIQRTFNDKGDLIKEQAKRNGVEVPVPVR